MKKKIEKVKHAYFLFQLKEVSLSPTTSLGIKVSFSKAKANSPTRTHSKPIF